ncbi:MAG: histidine--tRNA ligase [Armatimonadota bacterium]
MRYPRAEGTFDILPSLPAGRSESRSWVHDSTKWQWIEGLFRERCRRSGFHEIRTPVFEDTELFHRAVGDGTDIVVKETYDFTTRGGDRLTLRPEGTAGAIRAYRDGHLWLERPTTKLFYIGPNFRYESGQRGRYRQHHQAGVEVLGCDDPAVDAEVISLATAFYRDAGVQRLKVKINSVGTAESRALYLNALRAYAEPLLPRMSDDNRRRFRENPLRMLDSKDPRDIELLAGAPSILDHLDNESEEHFRRLRSHLDALGVQSEVDPRLVRGFDYYTRTAFEIQAPELGDKALGGGGRYNRLVEEIGGPPTPGIGFGLGIERVLLTLEESGAVGPEPRGLDAFLCPLGDTARAACVPLLARLRDAGIAVDMDYTGRRLKVMLEQADGAGAPFAVIIGEDELARGEAMVRALGTREQEAIGFDDLAQRLKRV